MPDRWKIRQKGDGEEIPGLAVVWDENQFLGWLLQIY
jgi:hypothetical protein